MAATGRRYGAQALYLLLRHAAAFLLIMMPAMLCCRAQDTARIYRFMNEELPSQEVGKSDWGIFFSAYPYAIDSSFCMYLSKHEWDQTPVAVREDLIRQCGAADTAWQRRFRWQSSKLYKSIVVTSTRRPLSTSAVTSLKVTPAERKQALKWIREWNRSPREERLINYTSIPLFSENGDYIMLLRGQNAGSIGWDTIYIYHKTTEGWVIAERIIISMI